MAMATVFAGEHVAAERGRAAALDRAHHLQLWQVEMPGVGPAEGGTEVAEDVLEFGLVLRRGADAQAGGSPFLLFFFARRGLAGDASGLSSAAMMPVATRV